MPTNWRKLYVMKNKAKADLLKVCSGIRNESGIYIFLREDENGIKFAYIGQAVKMEERLISHYIGYSQRIDISLKKRKLYDPERNPYGWRLKCIYCDKEQLNYQEQEHIKIFADKGWQLYNKTLGSQGVGKVSINDGQSTKGYRDGLKQGYENCRKEVREYFIKYFDFVPLECMKNKDGTLSKLVLRKLDEFQSFLNGKDTD